MSRRQQIALLLFFVIFSQSPFSSGQVRPIPGKFSHERIIYPGGPGPNRLLIDASLLAGSSSSWQFARQTAGSERRPMTIASGGLEDLRLYDSASREVPYLLILPPEPEPKWLGGRLAPVARARKTSGFTVDFGKALLMDRLQVSGIPAPFVKRCVVEASNDSRYWKRLRDDATIFDLPSEKLRRVEIELPQGEYRYVKVIFDDSASPGIPMPRSASARLVSAGSLPPRLEVPIKFERRESEPEVSRYRLILPGSNLPITAIKMSANGGNILRQARVSEGRLSGGEITPTLLGTATLRREVRGEVSAAEMSVTITPPQEAQLDLMIEDGNNPPLEITQISAEFAYLPWIYFDSVGKAPLTARYGSADLKEPRYDLEAARSSAAKVKTVEATWGEESGIKPTAESPSENGMPEVGASIDLGSFRYARAIAAGKPGLVALQLDAAVLAHSRSNLEDLRIAGLNGHQIPYLIENEDEPLVLDLPRLEKAEPPNPGSPKKRNSAGARSYYRLRLPYQSLPPARLVFTTSAHVFRRHVSILIEKNPFNERQEPWTESVAEGAWAHADQGTAAPALILRIPSLKTEDAMVAVDEGDNSPLPITSVRLLLPAHRLRFFRGSRQDLKLYYGRSDLEAPSYDLAIIAPRLMGAAAQEIQLGPEVEVVPVKAKSLPLILFWTILIIAVLVLLVLISRLVKKT